MSNHSLKMRVAGPLTAKQVDVIELVSIGKTNEEIAAILSVSPRSVAHRINRAWQTTDTHSRTQLACRAIREGWIK